MSTDPISDFQTRIRNAQEAHHTTVLAPASGIKLALAKILEREGYVQSVTTHQDGHRASIEVVLKYVGKVPMIRSIKRISTPGRRVYRKSSELTQVLSGQGISIVSTSAGLMTNKEARKRKLGGEIVCDVY